MAAVGLYAACAAPNDPAAPAPASKDGGGVRVSDFGKPCAVPADCSGGACIDVPVAGGTLVKRCSAPCDRDFDCVPGWLCSAPAKGERATCSCSATKEVCDGLDNDCNGVVDDEMPADLSCAAKGGGLCVNAKCGCQHRCGSECIDIATDPAHCGGCNVACPPGAACVAGACGCSPRTADAGLDAEAGVDAGKDASADAATSPALMMLCDYACVDVSSDPLRCGACGHACDANEACVDSKCICKGQQCGGKCVVTGSDPNNCGSCGTVCPYACTGGQCAPETIAAGQGGFGGFAVQGSKIYWSRSGRLLVCDKHGCASPGIVNSFRTLNQFELTPTKIYVRLDEYAPNQEPSFEKWFRGVGFCPIGGCPGSPNAFTFAPRLTAEGFTVDRQVTSMVAKPDRLFFATCDQNGCVAPRRVRACDLANDCAAGPQTLAEDANTNVTTFRMIGADATRVFWRTQSTIAGGSVYELKSCALPDCAGGPTSVVTGTGFVRDAVLVDGTLFFALDVPGSKATSGVVRCPASGCAAPTIVASSAGAGPGGSGPGEGADTVAASTDRVYWGAAYSPGLRSCAVTPDGGCTGPVITAGADGGSVRAIMVDEASVYWVDAYSSIKRFSRLLQ
jgi:hypothetical protein